MSKTSNKFNNIALFLGALALPYIYFMTVRPKLIQFEKTLDEKITGISDKELDKMKKKMEQIKIEKSQGVGENKLEKNNKI